MCSAKMCVCCAKACVCSANVHVRVCAFQQSILGIGSRVTGSTAGAAVAVLSDACWHLLKDEGLRSLHTKECFAMHAVC